MQSKLDEYCPHCGKIKGYDKETYNAHMQRCKRYDSTLSQLNSLGQLRMQTCLMKLARLLPPNFILPLASEGEAKMKFENRAYCKIHSALCGKPHLTKAEKVDVIFIRLGDKIVVKRGLATDTWNVNSNNCPSEMIISAMLAYIEPIIHEVLKCHSKILASRLCSIESRETPFHKFDYKIDLGTRVEWKIPVDGVGGFDRLLVQSASGLDPRGRIESLTDVVLVRTEMNHYMFKCDDDKARIKYAVRLKDMLLEHKMVVQFLKVLETVLNAVN